MTAGVFQELIQAMLPYTGALGAVHQFVYVWEGLTPAGAGVLFVVAALIEPAWHGTRRRAAHPTDDQLRHQRVLRAGIALVCLRSCLPLPATISVRC
jgi:hypothetical protein